MKKLATIIVIFLSQFLLAQKNDSLVLAKISNKFKFHLKSNLDSALYYAKALKTKSVELKNKNSEALANNFVGLCKIYSGDYDSALVYLNYSLSIHKKTGTAGKAICDVYSNIGICYDYKGDFATALQWYITCLKEAEKTNDSQVLAKISNNIGNIYYQQLNYGKALTYYLKALPVREELKDYNGAAICCINIANCYDNLKLSEKKEAIIMKCEKYARLSGDSSILGESYTLLASLLSIKKLYKESIKYFNAAISCYGAVNEARGLCDAYYQLGEVLLNDGQKELAHHAMWKSYSLSKEINYLSGKSHAAAGLIISHAYLNRADSSRIYLKVFEKTYDSLFSINNAQMVADMQTKYETDKKQQENDLLLAKNTAAIANAKKQNIIILFIVVALILVLVTAIVAVKGYKNKKEANNKLTLLNNEILASKEKIELQKGLIEEKQKDIIDSISYAKRLQNAIMPSDTLVKKCFPESFVLYKPKDIVAGDFYWLEQKGDDVLFAVADCTGHGVPGAMVSVVCSNALNRAFKEFNIIEPGKILDKTRELVVETFEKSESEVKDGMDISLAKFNKTTKQVSWAGANNSLWYIQNKIFKEVKADKQPIGIYSDCKPFTTHTFQLEKGDILYLFTDGLPDQFGGPKGKKYKYKQFSEILINNQHLSMDLQSRELENSFESWKNQLEQVDDVCVVGIKV